jgi:DNA-binding transcriptional LysR family regulator
VFNCVRSYHNQDFPAVAIEAEDVRCCVQSEALLERCIDVGFSWNIDHSSHLLSEPIFRARLAALMSENNPLAKRDTVRLKELAEEPLILFAREAMPTAHDKILGLYAAAGITPNIIIASSPNAVNNLVASGRGIYFGHVGSLIEPYNKGGIAVVRLSDSDATLDVQVAWRKDEISRAVVRFVSSIRKVFAEQTAGLNQEKPASYARPVATGRAAKRKERHKDRRRRGAVVAGI